MKLPPNASNIWRTVYAPQLDYCCKPDEKPVRQPKPVQISKVFAEMFKAPEKAGRKEWTG